ncbi:MAG: hypothetical protein ACKVOE_03410 [Rickettsiales bacterium]
MRLLVSMAAITLLAVFAAVLMAMVLAGAIWLAYAQLVAHGVTVAVAALLIGSALLALLLAAFMAMRHYWCRATNACSQMITRQSPISGRVSQVCDAFLQGFNKG